MSEPDKTNVTSDKIKKNILKDKKKLLEIYALVGGLIIASIQNTGSLIAINISANETIYKDSILATKAIIGSSNIAFFAFIFLLLIYYTKTFDEDPIFTCFLVILISAFFSYILINFINLYMDLSLTDYFVLFVCIFLAILLTLVQNSILMIIIEKKSSKIRNDIYDLTPGTFKTASNKQLALKIWGWRTRLWKFIIFGATVYLICCILIAYNPFVYTLISLWTISAMVLSIFLECLLTF